MLQHALDRDYEVVGVCRERSVAKLDVFKDRITIVPGATNDRQVIKHAVDGCDGVLTVLVPWGDRKIRAHGFTKLRPDDTDYWRKRGDKTLGLGHVFKYPYAYYDLLTRARHPELKRELDAKAWRMF